MGSKIKNNFFIFYRLKTNKRYLQELHTKTGRVVEIKKYGNQ